MQFLGGMEMNTELKNKQLSKLIFKFLQLNSRNIQVLK